MRWPPSLVRHSGVQTHDPLSHTTTSPPGGTPYTALLARGNRVVERFALLRRGAADLLGVHGPDENAERLQRFPDLFVHAIPGVAVGRLDPLDEPHPDAPDEAVAPVGGPLPHQ